MPDNNIQWFTEACAEAGSSIAFQIEEQLHSEQTEFQRIDIYRTTHWGNLMVIDGFIMLTSRDNFLYHEMMSHPALLTHPSPASVVIIGGGDCGTLREVLKHDSVQQATQVDIDERVTRLSEQYFPELCSANDDPRAELLFADGLRYMADCATGTLDLIIVDSTDPIGPAEGLFGPQFIADCYRALKPGGIIVQQSESPLIHQDILLALRQNMQDAGFDALRTLTFPQPCYPSGWWSATLAGKQCSLEQFRQTPEDLETMYYNSALHQALLTEPAFLRRVLQQQEPQ